MELTRNIICSVDRSGLKYLPNFFLLLCFVAISPCLSVALFNLDLKSVSLHTISICITAILLPLFSSRVSVSHNRYSRTPERRALPWRQSTTTTMSGQLVRSSILDEEENSNKLTERQVLRCHQVAANSRTTLQASTQASRTTQSQNLPA